MSKSEPRKSMGGEWSTPLSRYTIYSCFRWVDNYLNDSLRYSKLGPIRTSYKSTQNVITYRPFIKSGIEMPNLDLHKSRFPPVRRELRDCADLYVRWLNAPSSSDIKVPSDVDLNEGKRRIIKGLQVGAHNTFEYDEPTFDIENSKVSMFLKCKTKERHFYYPTTLIQGVVILRFQDRVSQILSGYPWM